MAQNVITIDTRQVLADMSRKMNTQLSQHLDSWAKNYNRSIKRRSGLQAMHEKLAKNAQSQMLQAYKTSGIGTRKSYREGDTGKLKRYSGGAMEKAIQAGGSTGDKDGVSLVNTTKMDRIAKQWYRLNFGAMPKGSKSPPSSGTVKFKSRSTGKKFQLDDYGPSGPFRIPYGFFSTTFKASSTSGRYNAVPRGKPGAHAFYVRNRDQQVRGVKSKPFFKRPVSRGIQGKRFLDAGAAYLNQNYGKELALVTDRWHEEAKRNIKK